MSLLLSFTLVTTFLNLCEFSSFSSVLLVWFMICSLRAKSNWKQEGVCKIAKRDYQKNLIKDQASGKPQYCAYVLKMWREMSLSVHFFICLFFIYYLFILSFQVRLRRQAACFHAESRGVLLWGGMSLVGYWWWWAWYCSSVTETSVEPSVSQDMYDELLVTISSRRSSLNQNLALKSQYDRALQDLADLLDTGQEKMAGDQKIIVSSKEEIQQLLDKHKVRREQEMAYCQSLM